MATVKFELAPLLAIIEKVSHLPKSPTTDDLFDPECWEGGKPLNKDGKTEAELKGEHFWPDGSRIKESHLTDSFSLVGDEGVYMMPNRKMEGSAATNGFLVYAESCNPNVDKDYYDNKRALFGGDDGAISIPTEWIRIAQKNNNTALSIRLTGTSVTLVSKPVGNRPKTLKKGMIFTLYDRKFELLEKGKKRGSWRATEVGTSSTFAITSSQLREAMFEVGEK